MQLVRNAKALVIQTNVRRYLAQKRYQRSIRNVIIVQCQIRKFLARKELKRLKLEAKSVEHQKKLNQGLENKIISLQQKLSESEKRNKEFKKNQSNVENLNKELEALKQAQILGKEAASKVKSLEEEIQILKSDLDSEKSEKIDIIHQRKLETDSWKEKESDFEDMIENLKKKLNEAEVEFEAKGQEASTEKMRNLENERDSLKNECDQERIAYQKLLKAYNKLEAQFENAQDELSALKNPNGSETFDSMSFASMSLHDEESAYGGSQSGTSSIRNSNVPDVSGNIVPGN